MRKLFKISCLNVKNVICSKEFILGMAAAFAYSMLWVIFVHPTMYRLSDYDFEFGRFLYLIILYAAVSILRNDIKSNAAKTVFTGVFTRTQIMISKGIGLILLCFIFYAVFEINNILISCIMYKKIGLSGFININHLQLFIAYMAITLCMGSLMILIISLIFSEKKSILFFIVILSMINFYSAAITAGISSHPEAAQNFSLYMKTPFYNTIYLMGNFNLQSAFIQPVLINIAWAVLFYASAVFVMNKREIK